MPLKWVKSIPAATARSTNHSSPRESGQTSDGRLPAFEDCAGSAAGASGLDVQEAAPPHGTNRRSRSAANEQSRALTDTAPDDDTEPRQSASAICRGHETTKPRKPIIGIRVFVF